MQKSTDELLATLKSKQDIQSYLDENQQELFDKNLSEQLDGFLADKNLTKAAVIDRANLDRVYAYQIFSGTRIPSRDKLLQLCIGMQLSLDEVQQLLKLSGFAPLYPRDKRDSMLIFALNQRLSVIDTNCILADLGEKLLE